MSASRQAVQRRALRRELRLKIAALRIELRAALAAKKARMRELVSAIRAERLALRERLRAERRRALDALRESARTERVRAREAWQRRLREARDAGASDVVRLRAELGAARARAAEERKIARAHQADRAREAAKQSQTDGEVRALIPRELVPMFDRVAASIRPHGDETRAEVFLRHAEARPAETFKIVEPHAHAHVEATREKIADVARASGAGITAAEYAAKRAARVERMRAKAAKLAATAEGQHARGRSIADRIPLGQPILLGHHSQKRHQRDLKRINHAFDTAYKLASDAKALEARADRAERSTAISSDDPDAVAKLREKLVTLKADRERMKVANKAIRRGGDVAGALAALGFSERVIKLALEPDPMGRIGFPSYVLQNAAGEAARVERRIRELEARATRPAPADVVVGDARISEADNRVQIRFPGVPPEAVRRALKSRGFRWAPSVGAWQRLASNGAWYAAKEVLGAHATTGGLPS